MLYPPQTRPESVGSKPYDEYHCIDELAYDDMSYYASTGSYPSLNKASLGDTDTGCAHDAGMLLICSL